MPTLSATCTNDNPQPRQVFEADHSSTFLEVLALTHSGRWEPIVTVAISEPEIIQAFRTPLLLRFGYAQTVQSDLPQAPGRD